MSADSNQLASIRAALPQEGLFAEKGFLLSPDPFPIDDKFAKDLELLGHRLYVFQRACNELYQRSVKGKQPEAACGGTSNVQRSTSNIQLKRMRVSAESPSTRRLVLAPLELNVGRWTLSVGR